MSNPSLRRLPAITADSFDNRDQGTHDQKPTNRGEVVQQDRMTRKRASLNVGELLDVISILLKDYQSKPLKVSDDPNNIAFPWAWLDLKEGLRVKDLTSNVYFTIEKMVPDNPQFPRNNTILKGPEVIKEWHHLRLDPKQNVMVKFTPAFPDSRSEPYKFEEEKGFLRQSGAPFIDTVTYTIVKEEPASTDGKFFGDKYRELVPRYRESIRDPALGRQEITIKGQLIHTQVRFDLWTKTNVASESFREWLRLFFRKYNWLIHYHGVRRFIWVSSGTEEHVTRWRNDIVHRSIWYNFETEHIETESSTPIKKIEFNTNLLESISKEVISFSIPKQEEST